MICWDRYSLLWRSAILKGKKNTSISVEHEFIRAKNAFSSLWLDEYFPDAYRTASLEYRISFAMKCYCDPYLHCAYTYLFLSENDIKGETRENCVRIERITYVFRLKMQRARIILLRFAIEFLCKIYRLFYINYNCCAIKFSVMGNTIY